MKCPVVAVLAVSTLVPNVHCAANQIVWCYHHSSCNESTWAGAAPMCRGTRQSPINIVSHLARSDSSLTPFTFRNYNSTSALTTISNTGNTVQVTIDSGVQISGGGLSEPYDSLQFHLHWGDGSSVPGSEHTVDDKRYAMELHIVNSKSSYNGNTTLAIKDSEGLTALGFFIEEMQGNATDEPKGWWTLTSYLSNITNSGDSVSMAPGISLDDLLVGVDRTKYYRYLGSLTTPNCNEAVVWTVFKDPIKVSRDLIGLFSTTIHFSNSSSQFMTNVYRSIQISQEVTTQPSSSRSLSATCSLGLVVLSLILGTLEVTC
ncbi:carbonic anhydrase 4-like [Betta splendens]|uniref:Carbonic anhydrase n=1 Tax=Betta splendens TaxID=158456 RepID=A0A6P7L787_BETSP|nr:carbonic anhydrase 4-like [Betta splendens]